MPFHYFRLIEEIRDACDVELDNDVIYMAPVFDEFVTQVILKKRGVGGEEDFEYDAVSHLVLYPSTIMFLVVM